MLSSSSSSDTDEDEPQSKVQKPSPPPPPPAIKEDDVATLAINFKPCVAKKRARAALTAAGGDFSRAMAALSAERATGRSSGSGNRSAPDAVTAGDAEYARLLQEREYGHGGSASGRVRCACRYGANCRQKARGTCLYRHDAASEQAVAEQAAKHRAAEHAEPSMSSLEPPPAQPPHGHTAILIVTWNCQHGAAPASGQNKDKLPLTMRRLQDELGGAPDALALQETKFKDEKQLLYAQSATPNYIWCCSPGAPRPVAETARTSLGLGSWLLIRKDGPLNGGTVVDLSAWDDQYRVVAVETRHGIVVAAYLPACCNQAAIERGDGPRYSKAFWAFLEQHKHRMLAVVGDLNITFEARDRTDNNKQPLLGCDSHFRSQLREAGLVDAWRHHHPYANEYSREDEDWERSRASGEVCLTGSWARVDHVLVPTNRVAESTATILSQIGPREPGRKSDHVPVAVVIRM